MRDNSSCDGGSAVGARLDLDSHSGGFNSSKVSLLIPRLFRADVYLRY